MTDEHEDNRVLAYLRERGQATPPDDLIARVTSPASVPTKSRIAVGRVRWLSLAAAVVAIAVVGVLVVRYPVVGPSTSPTASSLVAVASRTPNASPPSTATSATTSPHPAPPTVSPATRPPSAAPSDLPVPTAAPSTAPTPAPSVPVGDVPTSVFGMPVVSVAQARQFEASGGADGRVFAVAGYFSAEPIHCYSGVYGTYTGLLEPVCVLFAFGDTPREGRVCVTTNKCGGTIPPPAYVPVFGPGANLGAIYDASSPGPAQMVVVGHIGDPQSWQCPYLMLEECQQRFVADRVVWANGQYVGLQPPALWDATDTTQLALRMNLDDVTAASGQDELIAAMPIQARDVWMFDPRFSLTGDQAVWLVRYFTDQAPHTDGTRSMDIAVIDDATGEMLDAVPLEVDPTYAPARLYLAARRLDVDAQGNVDDGLDVLFGLDDSIRANTGAGGCCAPDSRVSLPLVVDPGSHTLKAWLAKYDPATSTFGEPQRACSMDLDVNSLDYVGYRAVFTADSACTFAPFQPPVS